MAVALALVVLALVAQPPGAEPSRPAAEAAEAALRHWEAGRYDEARKAIARAYMIEPWRQYLYARAQIERADGKCADAIEFYRLYLDAKPPADAVALAEQGIAECEQQLANAPQPRDDDAAPRLDAPPPPKPWWKDGLGLGLVTGGGVTMVVGGGLFGLVAADRRASQGSDDHAEFGRRVRRAERASVAGVTLLSIGAALFVAGVVRLAVVQSKARRAGRAARIRADGATLTLRW